MKALITGICGQTGSYTAELLLSKGYEVHGMVRRISQPNFSNLEAVKNQITFHTGDMTDSESIFRIIKNVRPDEIYNFAAMSQVRDSYDHPSVTQDINANGLMRILESVRVMDWLDTKIYQACSSEMFGKVQQTPQNETTPFYPRSPYGSSKVTAYNHARLWREAYGMKVYCGILFNHECVTAETPVIFKKSGIIDIREIQDIVAHREDYSHGKKYQTEPIGLQTWDGTSWANVTLATATWNGGEKEVFEVEARGGIYRATGDHVSFLDGCIQVKTSELNPGDRLQIYPLPLSTEETSMSLDEANFLGRMAGDGYICPDGGSARFTGMDRDLLRTTANLFRKITGGKYREDFSKRSGYSDTIVPSMEFSGATPFFTLWRSELYDERGKKKVPRRVLNADNDVISAFLSGYNDADGLKAGNYVKREFKSFKTNSAVLAQGLCFLSEALGYRVSTYKDREYYSLNIGEVDPVKGAHLQKPLDEIRKVTKVDYVGWLFDLATDSSTFSAGIGRTWVHNSPRRGPAFLSRKVCIAVAEIVAGKRDKLVLGNLEAKRDWGYAKEYVDWIYRIMQHPTPDDFVIGTGETHSVKEWVIEAFRCAGIEDWEKYTEFDKDLTRPAEVDLLLADPSKSKRILGFEAKVKFHELVNIMVDAELAKI